MKLILLFTTFLSATSLPAQNTGINTATPSYPLHVVGNTSNYHVLMVESEHPQATRLLLKNNFTGASMAPTAGIAYQVGTGFVADHYVTKDHKWILNTYPETGSPVFGAITADGESGFTGINTVTPFFRLHVRENQGQDVCIYAESNSPDFATIAVDARNFSAEAGFLIARQGFQRAYMGVNASNDWFLHVTGATNALYVKDSLGFIGLQGQTNPGFPLNFSSTIGDKISLNGNSGNHYGFGIATALLQVHTDVSASDIGFGYGSSFAFTENMRIKGNGKIGIGTINPGARLQINQPGNWSASESGDHALEIWDAHETLYIGACDSADNSYIQAVGNNFIHSLALQPRGGFVGINKTNPAASLDVNGSGRFSGDLMVQNGKGIVRSSGTTQQKIVTTIVPVNLNLSAGQTVSFNINWSEPFSSPPSAFVGNIVAGGGFAEVIISFSVTTSNGATVWIYNPKNSNVNPNFSFTAVAIGAQ